MIKNAVKNALLLLSSLLLALLLAEMLLRFASPSSPAPHFYRPHPLLGFEPVPGASGWRAGENRTPVWFEFDQHGFRKMPDAPAGDADATILFLGDSFTEGAQVPYRDTFVQRVEDRLRSQGKSVRVINAGVSGFGTAQQLLAFERMRDVVRPDIVVLAFCSGNDVTDSAAVFNPDGGVSYRLQDDRLVGPLSPGQTPSAVREWLRANTALYPWLAVIRQRLNRAESVEQAIAAHGQVFYGSDDDWREAWAVNQKLLARLAESVRDVGAEFIVAVLPVGYQVYRDPRHHHPDAEDLYLVEKQLAAVAAENQFLTVPLLDEFKEYAETAAPGATSLFFDDIGHFTSSGHEVAANGIAAALVSRL